MPFSFVLHPAYSSYLEGTLKKRASAQMDAINRVLDTYYAEVMRLWHCVKSLLCCPGENSNPENLSLGFPMNRASPGVSDARFRQLRFPGDPELLHQLI